jgi:hypothetical protein
LATAARKAYARSLIGMALYPPTVEAKTGGGGRHLLYKYPHGCEIPNSASKVAPGIDVKSDGGCIAVAPSIHPDPQAKPYTWIEGHAPGEIDFTPLPPHWLELLLKPAASTSHKANGQGNGQDIIPEGERNGLLFKRGCLLRRNGFERDEIEDALLALNTTRCKPPLEAAEVATIATSAARYAPSAADDSDTPPSAKAEDQPGMQETWPAPLTPDAYHGLAGDIVRTIEPHTEFDPAAILVQLLLAFGNCIGPRPYFYVEGSRHTANLFTVLVGPTSKGRKGTSWARVMQLFNLLNDDNWAFDRIESGLSSGEGLIWHVRDPINKRRHDGEDGSMVNEEVDAGVSDKRLTMIEEEFASTLRVMGREGSTLSPVIRKAWDGGRLSTMTKNSPATATGAHISIIGHVTRRELRRNLDRTECGNGFANRFLFLCVRRARTLPDGGNLADDALQELSDRLTETIKYAREIDEVKRDVRARAIWHAVYPELSEGLPGLLGAVTSRAEAQVTRLSMLYALLDQSNVIHPAHLKAALAIWEYAESSARYVFGSAVGDPVADQILRSLRASADGLSRTEISSLFKRNQDAQTISRALDVLRSENLARSEQRPTDKRPVEVWRSC